MYRNTYTFEEFRKAVQTDKVESVWIEQNKAVPTGSVEITLKENSETRYLYVSDVNEVQEMLAEALNVSVAKVTPDAKIIISENSRETELINVPEGRIFRR